MTEAVDVHVYFNFRSPYCYLASKRMFAMFDDFHANLVWKPLGGWDGRSPPEVAKTKLPIARQDMARFARRLGIPVNPPPTTTEPTLAGAASLLAEERGVLREYIVEVMRAEWATGADIGQSDVLLDVGESLGLDRDEMTAAFTDEGKLGILRDNWEEAQAKGVIGVPTFVIDDQIFWGQDRIDFVEEYLHELRLRRL
ncbi:MAG: 2-hydroxychromene-2-carboxylate isomerase [Gammaproteobacteria bacterium]